MSRRRLSSTGYSPTAAAEKHSLVLPGDWPAEGRAAVPGVIFCPGGGQNAHSFAESSGKSLEVFSLAEAGYPVLTADMGFGTATASWGTTTHVARITEAWTYLKAQAICHPTRVILLGVSLGFVGASNWARANASNVVGLHGSIGAIDVEAIRAANRNSLQASIEAAYVNNAGWQAARAARNPAETAAAHTFPVRLSYSTDDPVSTVAEVNAFDAAAPNCDVVSVGAHAHDMSFVDKAALVTWVQGLTV